MLLLGAIVAISPALAPGPAAAAPRTPRVSVTGLPTFSALAIDASRNRVYGIDSANGRVYALDGTTGQQLAVLSFGTNSWPLTLDISPDDSTLAVALYGLGYVQLINLAGWSAGSTIQAAGENPESVRYGRSGRLYTIDVATLGNGDYVHIYDTASNAEVGRSNSLQNLQSPRLAITSDGKTLFALMTGGQGSYLDKFDVSTDAISTPPLEGGFGGIGNAFAITPDGSHIFENGGQVFDSALEMVGTFPNPGAGPPGVSYASGRAYVSMTDAPQVEVVSGSGFPYHALGYVNVNGSPYANDVNAAGTVLYVSTTTEFDIVDLSQPLAPPPSRTPGYPYADMVLDSARGVLYASQQGSGYVDVISASTGAVVDSIDVGETGKPNGMSISPDGSTLAVALHGAWQIVLIDLDTRTVAGHMYPANGGGVLPWDVKYGRAGRLYESSSYFDVSEYQGLRIFDTTTDQQIGQFSNGDVYHEPWLAISPAGNDLYTVENEQFGTVIHAYDVSTDSPGGAVNTANPNGTGRLMVRGDGAQVMFTGGTVYSRQLASVLNFTGGGAGGYVAYAASANDVFTSGGGYVNRAVFASPWTGGLGDIRPVPGAGPVQADSTGATVYVNVGSAVDIIKWGTPDPPRNVTAVHGDAQATVSWSAPLYTGTSDISGYTVTTSPGGLTKTVSGLALNATMSPLVNGTTYTFTVVATNAAGDSVPSAVSNAVTPRVPTVPTQPLNVTATTGHLQAIVGWSAPVDNGDSLITGYTVTSSPGNFTASAGPSATGAVMTGLTAGVSYTFTVVATNGIGDSLPSAASNAVVIEPLTAPGPPTGVSAAPGNAQAIVSWTPPADDGGSAITGYTVSASPGLVTVAVGPLATTALVSGLTNETTYTFTVIATNSIGSSSPSAPSNGVTPFAPTVPTAPLNVAAVGGHGQATVTWSTPLSDGRSAITGYTVTSSPDGLTVSVGPSTFVAVVTGLTNGTGYTFTVIATNAVGPSSPSDPSNAVFPGAPSAPVGVNATPGVGSATITWSAPSDTGVTAITQYTVVSSGGAVATVSGSTLTVTLTGLTPVSHHFTVSATNGDGTGPVSAPSPDVTPADGGTYNALTPVRILDTRNGTGGFPIGRVGAGQTINLQVTGRGGVPAGDVTAVVLNVTVTNPTGTGFVTVYRSGSLRPLASNLNFVAGQTVPNLVEVPVGSNGKVALYVGGAGANLIADVEGWVGDSLNSYTRAGLFNSMMPQRILDTRSGVGAPSGKVGPGQTLRLQVVGAIVPYSISAVVLNLTVTDPTQAGYLTVFSSNSSQPLASNLNFAAGQTVANRVIVPVGPDGAIDIYNGPGSVHVIADVSGWFTDATSTMGGSAFVAMQPFRIFDSRSCSGCSLAPGDIFWVQFVSWPEPITAVALNVTATNASAPGYLTVFPDNGVQPGLGESPPGSSDVNFGAGRTVPSFVLVGLGDSTFDIANGPSSTAIIVDMDGFFGAIVSAPPDGLHLAARETSVGQTPLRITAPRVARAG